MVCRASVVSRLQVSQVICPRSASSCPPSMPVSRHLDDRFNLIPASHRACSMCPVHTLMASTPQTNFPLFRSPGVAFGSFATRSPRNSVQAKAIS